MEYIIVQLLYYLKRKSLFILRFFVLNGHGYVVERNLLQFIVSGLVAAYIEHLAAIVWISAEYHKSFLVGLYQY